MTAELKPYPTMKDSGVEWLGMVPEHWDVKPGRACYVEKKEPNTGLVEKTVLSLSYGKIVVKPEDKLHGLVPASFETYQIIEPGDIICRPTDLQNDYNSLRFGLSDHRGIITSAYMCFNTHENLDYRYGYLLLHSYDLLKIFYGLGSGLRQNLSWGDFKYLPCVIPPLPEQVAIARYLDYVDVRVRRLTEAKRKLIGLLTEYKQAIIHRAVTRGLDPNVPLKDSGIEWLGMVPQHWEVRKLRTQFRKSGSGTTPSGEQYYGGEIPWVMTGDLNDATITKTKRSVTAVAIEDVSALRMFPTGSLIVAMYGATIGKTGLLSMEACTNQACCVLFEPVDSTSANFLQMVVNIFRPNLIEQSYGGGQPNINAEIVKALKVPIPPLSEQAAIVEYLDRTTAEIDIAVARTERQIELLNEYRTRLIADVVTGKLDVRDATLDPEERDR